MRQLRHAWSDSAGEHPALALRNGGSEAVVVPAIGGRIVWLGGAGAKTNLLAEGLPGTFGYPCVGGYEEYTLTNHQSAGFAQPFEVVKRGKSEVKLRAAIETGHTLDRRIWLSPRGEAFVVSTLRNPTDAALPGCLRAHLEIDLKTKPADLELFFLRDGAWQPVEGGIGTGRIMHEDQVPEGWAFWSPRKRRGLYQAWNRTEVGTLYLSAVGTEPTTIALDLARGRYNEAIAPGSSQTITHRFGALWNPLPLRTSNKTWINDYGVSNNQARRASRRMPWPSPWSRTSSGR
jgi:hypothetical protein